MSKGFGRFMVEPRLLRRALGLPVGCEIVAMEIHRSTSGISTKLCLTVTHEDLPIPAEGHVPGEIDPLIEDLGGAKLTDWGVHP